MKTSINTVFPKCNKGMRAITMAGVTRLERYWSVEQDVSRSRFCPCPANSINESAWTGD